MKLIENWRQWYRMFSVQMLLFITGLQGILAVLPPDAQDARLPFIDATYREVGLALTIAAAVFGMVGRMIDQGIAKTEP